jgi:hypothetical protein
MNVQPPEQRRPFAPSYSPGVFAPGVEGGTTAQYKCGHHLLVAHGKAVQLYRGKYQQEQGVSQKGGGGGIQGGLAVRLTC